MSRGALRIACVLEALWLCTPATAHAYSDPLQYATPALEAGGGGHYYTGSPADGYGCDTCHRGGEPPTLQVLGVPARYVPGASYELTLKWPRGVEHAAAVLELTDASGRGAGELVLPPASEYEPDELCVPKEAAVLAAQLVPAERSRSIASVADCGATALRVQWRAPAQSVGPVWLAGAVLGTNHDGDLSGDGATHFVHAVPAFGEPAPPLPRITGTCAAQPGEPGSCPPGVIAMLAALGLSLVRRRRARRTVLVLALAATGCAADDEDVPARVAIHRGQAVRPWDAVVPADAAQDAAIADAADTGAATAPRFALRVTTLPQGGRYEPRNTGAIWIEDDAGAWLKSLEVWASVRMRYLVAFGEVNPTRNEVDAVSGATLREHVTHEASWDLRDVEGTAVEHGLYRVVIEVTDRDGPGKVARMPFELGDAPFAITPDDTDYYRDMELRYEP